MKRYTRSQEKDKHLYVGVDLHLRSWHVTMRTEQEEVFSGGIPGEWEALKRLLKRYPDYQIHVAYEAGYFGYWLHDEIETYGGQCIVVPPTLIPIEYGNRVKTDPRDSRKLAHLLAKGMLKRVWVPSKQERYHRQVLRRRRQLVRDRVRIQCRIKSELRFYGIDVPIPVRRWSKNDYERLRRFRFKNHWMQQNFEHLLDSYAFVTSQIEKQEALVKDLSETARYRDRMALVTSVPGIGVISGMEILVELGDIGRFKRADRLAAYAGLTPSQYSSADKVRMGRISKAGRSSLRATLVEVSWRLIGKDVAMREKYERIKARAGTKRAIVAVARMTLIRVRRILLDKEPYAIGVAA